MMGSLLSRTVSKRAATLLVGLAVFGGTTAGCGPSLPKVDPNGQQWGNTIDPNQKEAKVIVGNGEPLVVDWTPTARGDLEVSMREGIAVVSYDTRGLRVLPACHIDGKYGFLGMSMKQQLVRLESADEVKANLPLGGVGIAANFGGEFQQGAVLDVALVMVGKYRTTWHKAKKRDLVGDCPGATHIVRGAMVGAFAVDKGQKQQARAAAQIFGFGGSGGTAQSQGFHIEDGRLSDCQGANPDSTKPPSQCGALVRLELAELEADQAPVVQQSEKEEGVKVVTCPAGMVKFEGKCTNASNVKAYECSGQDGNECGSQCKAGNLASCSKFAIMALVGANGVPKKPFDAAKLLALSCKSGFPRACAYLGEVMLDGNFVQQKDPKFALDLFTRACNDGDEVGCNDHGLVYLFGQGVPRDTSIAAKSLLKACSGGWKDACSNLGVMMLGGNGLNKDDAKAAALFKMSCDGNSAMGCSNLGYMLETGQGVRQDVPKAVKHYEQACNARDESCASLASMYQMGKGVAKNESNAVSLYRKSCNGQNILACAFLRTYVDPSVKVEVDNAKNAVTVWQGSCTNGIVRDCTQVAVVALSLGQRENGLKLMKKACELGDDWACFNDKLVIKLRDTLQ
ncbi:MAG: tetratricopeptide repeat protein [Polyangiaceae bacterium]